MVDTVILTDNDTYSVEQSSPNLVPMNAASVSGAPPQESTSYSPFAVDESNLGSYELAAPRRARTISPEVHKALLERGLEEYDDLWRSLAQK